MFKKTQQTYFMTARSVMQNWILLSASNMELR